MVYVEEYCCFFVMNLEYNMMICVLFYMMRVFDDYCGMCLLSYWNFQLVIYLDLCDFENY